MLDESNATPAVDNTLNWERQAEQFRQELDQLNPKLNVAEAMISDLTGQLQKITAEKEEAEAKATQALETAKLNLGTAEAEAKRHVETINGLNVKLEESRAAARDTKQQLEDSQNENQRLAGIVKQQCDCLRACLRGAENHVTGLKKAIELGG